MRRLLVVVLVAGVPACACGPSIYEKAARKRAPRDCKGIPVVDRAGNERCALANNRVRFTGALFELDGSHRITDRMKLTYTMGWEFQDCGAIDFDVTIIDPEDREHRTTAVFECQTTCSPNGDVCYGQHHKWLQIPVKWSASPFLDEAGRPRPGNYRLEVRSRHGHFATEPVALTALSSPAVSVDLGRSPGQRGGRSCGPHSAVGTTIEISVPHDSYLRQPSKLNVTYNLARDYPCGTGTGIGFRATMRAATGEPVSAQQSIDCKPECTPYGIGHQCNEVWLSKIYLGFDWERDPYRGPDGLVQPGIYRLSIGTLEEACEPDELALRVEPSLDIVPTRALPASRRL